MKAVRVKDIQRVWRKFQQRRDHRIRNILLKYYLHLVKYNAERMHARLPSCVELEDLKSAGIFGLAAAIENFDPELGHQFETYGNWRVKGSIRDALRKSDKIPRLVRRQARQLAQVTRKLEAVFGRRPTNKELADELGLEENEFYKFLKDSNAVSFFSLSAEFAGNDGENDFQEISGITDCKSPSPLLEAQKRDLKEFISQGFTRQEQLILTLYHLEEMTMKEIGLALGISESRVCQIHSSVIARLRDRMRRQSCYESLIPEQKS